MIRSSSTTFALASVCVMALTCSAAATTIVSSGHVDVAVRYGGGVLSMESRVGTSPYTILPPGEVAHVVAAASRETRRAAAVYEPLGVAVGAPFYKLPQGSFEATLENAPFLGLAAESVANGIFIGNVVRLSLVAVEGPGHFSLWRETASGPGFESRPGFSGIPIASSDGIDASDYVLLPTSLHEHANWGFSAPGRYFVTFAAGGELVAGGSVSASGTFRFDVDLPAMPADLNGDGVVDRGDLGLFVREFGRADVVVGADFTGDGLVGLADLAVLQASLSSPQASAALAAVPEPSAIWLILPVFVAAIRSGAEESRLQAIANDVHLRYKRLPYAGSI